MTRKRLFVLDVYPILFRSHFAMINQSIMTSSGLNTSAILGFCNYLFQLIFKEKPTHIVAAFDSNPGERKELMPQYKATRDKMPEDMVIAKKYIHQLIQALNIDIVEEKGYEADDVIGTIANKAAENGFEVFIVSPDKDFAQIVKENIYLYRPSYKGVNFEVLDAEGVKVKYGVPPSQMADLLALKGDPSDNIPGVPKIGDKTALELLKSYGSVEAVLENKDKISKKNIRETLTNNRELAILSKKVATINVEVPIEVNPKEYQIKAPDTETLIELLDILEFKKLKERIFANPFYKQLIRTSQKSLLLTEADLPECEIMQIKKIEEFQNALHKVYKEKVIYFQAYYINNDIDFYFLSGNSVYNYYLSERVIPDVLKDILESEHIEKVTYDIKSFARKIFIQDVEIKGPLADILLIHYLINPEANHRFLNIKAQVSNSAVLSSDVPADTQRCFEVSSLEEVKESLSEQLIKFELDGLYKNLELPLAYVLAEMEINGIRFDEEVLKEISALLKARIDKLEKRIYELAGVEFNIKSSKQTAEIFLKLIKNDAVKKTKTGQLSTAESVLQDLAGRYEIADYLLQYRKLSKVVSTYTDSLPKYINADTGRIHADFNQAVTATGRLSCSNPNLQNLPILTEEGREVRKAVVPQSDRYLILAADYSQIELRLLAALSKDEALAKAFKENKDIHTITAARVFNVSETDVTEDMRSKAKMVNYGIAYGISPYGLSQNLKIKQAEAKEIIDQYFENFPAIKNFIDSQIEFARKNGYTCTLTGRRRLLSDINSKNGTVRKMAERIAINAPIQGLAADMIKIAMVNIQKVLKENGLQTKMILQVHDELVFEVLKEELEVVAKIVKDEMENAVDLAVPVEVNIGVGNNWLDLEDYISE